MEFYVFILLLTDRSSDTIISALVKQGFNVGPGIDRPVVVNNDWPVAQMILRIVVGNMVTTTQVKDTIQNILDKNNVKYYSIIVTHPTEIAWAYTNISLSEIDKQRAKRIQRASHLKLVEPPPSTTKELSDENPEQ